MNKSIRNIIIILIVAIGLGGAAYYTLNSDKQNPSTSENENKEQSKKPDTNEEDNEDGVAQVGIEVGKKLPDFKLSTLKGDQVSLRDYEGKIVLLNFWATWCVYCDEEMPDLQMLSEENEDLTVVGINVEEGESLVQKYVDDGGYDFEVLLDSKGEVAREYLVSGLPASYFIDEDGKFLGLVQGMLTYEQMNEILDDIRDGNISQ